MPAKRNNIIPNGHFHKDWQRYIKTWFNQPMRKKRRALKRAEKAQRVAPRPASGSLKPLVVCPTIRHNTKIRLGRGFTRDELKAAGVSPKLARSIGISFDLRRKNRSLDSLQRNVERLKAYKARLIIFPNNPKKPHKGDSSAEEVKLATQLKGTILPITNNSNLKLEKARKITPEDLSIPAYKTLRKERANKKYKGKRERKARLAEEEASKK